jgi:hypothetical protein
VTVAITAEETGNKLQALPGSVISAAKLIFD